ncbi:histidine phosphatase family protein [Microbacterium sp. ASV49]|uniref:Histidine phosphatase family protein n=1 Tax=Microbacterium candidum TaxID=3041922 RepID=A0ABT7MZH8_9MICO|nr:histidine phosphatase family protein [Microbacterium sp. ASV49]MDL9979857.1 histidine phosphatase family protein [Microbacterium sp. ASV49]
MTTLVFVRHGETDWNLRGRIQGTTDIPLNDTGRTQAMDAADALRGELDGHVAIVTSDLSRARETADIIAERLGLPAPQAYPHLRERAYGEAEGLTSDEIAQRWGPMHSADVPGAESAAALRRRALHGVRRVVRDVRRASAPAPATVIVVSHGALIRELARHATRGDLPEPGTRLPNGGGYTMLWERERLRIVDDSRSVETALVD